MIDGWAAQRTKERAWQSTTVTATLAALCGQVTTWNAGAGAVGADGAGLGLVVGAGLVVGVGLLVGAGLVVGVGLVVGAGLVVDVGLLVGVGATGAVEPPSAANACPSAARAGLGV